ADVKALKKLIDIVTQHCKDGKIWILSVCINKDKMSNDKFQEYGMQDQFGFLYYQVLKYITKAIKNSPVEIKLFHDEGSGFKWEKICQFLAQYFSKQTYQEIIYTQEELQL